MQRFGDNPWTGLRADAPRETQLAAARAAPRSRSAESRVVDSRGAEPVAEAMTQQGMDGDDILATSGPLTVKVTRDPAVIAAAQRLRYSVFYEEMSAAPTPEMAASRRDFDRYDPICDHLVATDARRAGDDAVIGAYRLLRQNVAEANGGFYSSAEYDIAPLMTRLDPGLQVMELGRSCVHADYRTNVAIQLLWRGIAAYIAKHRVGLLFGCASLQGTDPDALAAPLSYLAHEHAPPDDWRVRALPELYTEMKRVPREELDLRSCLRALPPLIKGYLRLGCWIGDGAVIDHQFGTIDVFIILPTERISGRFVKKFDPDAP